MKGQADRPPRTGAATAPQRPPSGAGGDGRDTSTVGRFLGHLARLETGPKLGKGRGAPR